MAKLRPVGDWIDGRFEIFAVHPGGMGVVYVAHDHKGEAGRNLLAIKTLREEWLLDADWAARFAAECELWVRLGSAPQHRPRALAVERFDDQTAHPPGTCHRWRPPAADRDPRARYPPTSST